ncbi:MAG: isochorismatase family cysteine hydrolase [Patescibacteria group bacterium]
MKTVLINAEPKPIEINTNETALLVIDMQNDFMCKGGYGEFLGNDPEVLQRAIVPAQTVLARARELGMLVLHTREGHLSDLSDCPKTKLERWPEGHRIGDMGPMGRILIRGEKGHSIIDDMAPLESEIVIDKPGKNAFYKTNLEEILHVNKMVNIFMVGVTTDICCSATISSGNDRGFNMIVVSDAVASYDENRHKASLDIIKAQGGILGWVASSSDVINGLK